MKNSKKRQKENDVKFIKEYMAFLGYSVKTPIEEVPEASKISTAMVEAIKYSRGQVKSSLGDVSNSKNWFERQELWVRLIVYWISGFITGGLLVYYY